MHATFEQITGAAFRLVPARPLRLLCALLVFARTGSGLAAEAQAQAVANHKLPNILYILADDMGVGDLSCLNPNSAWKTPNLDRLAAQGRTFTDAHSASGVCTPSRYAIMTGRYSFRGPLKSSVLHGYDKSLIEPNRLTVPQLLRNHGYATAMFGKWHLGVDWVQAPGTIPGGTNVDFSKPFGGGPTAHGFDTFLGISASLDMPPYVYLKDNHALTLPTEWVQDSPKPKMWRAGVISPDFHHAEVQPRLISETVDYLKARAGAGEGKPFFIYLALAAPHTPIIPTAEFEGKTRSNPYGDFVAQVDADIGRVLKTLDELHLADNTLVFFTADNGCAPAVNLDELKKLGHDPSAGARGHKADLFEGGHHEPFIARWPGQTTPGSRCSQVIGQLDLLATCAEIVGAPLPDSAGEDSVSMLPLLRGRDTTARSQIGLVNESNNGSLAIHQGKWKLLLCPDSGGWSEPKPDSKLSRELPKFQLYDLEADPTEKANVESQHPEIVQRLGKLLAEQIQRGRSTPGKDQPYDKTTPWPQTAWMSSFAQ